VEGQEEGSGHNVRVGGQESSPTWASSVPKKSGFIQWSYSLFLADLESGVWVQGLLSAAENSGCRVNTMDLRGHLRRRRLERDEEDAGTDEQANESARHSCESLAW